MSRHILLPVLALFISTAFLLAGGGMQGVLFPVRGQAEGFSNSQIGLIGTGWAIGFTVGCIIVPQLVRRVGHVRTFGALAALLAIIILVSGLFVEAYGWVLLRGASGLCFSGCYMIIESWLNERVSDEHRGMLFSLYLVVAQLSFMVGQYLITVANIMAETLFMLCAILYALAVLPTALSKAQSPAPLQTASLDLGYLFRNSPTSVVGALTAGLLIGAFQSFGPVYGAQNGMDTTSIANMMVLVSAGAILFQLPLGKLSDMIDRRYVMIGLSAVGTVVGVVVAGFPLNGAEPGLAFYGLILVMGGFVYPIYGIVTAHANDRADPDDFVKISSGLLIIYGIGTIMGPLITGPVMEILGSGALFHVIAASHLVLTIYLIYRVSRREAPADEDQMDYQAISVTFPQTQETWQLDPRSDAETYMASNEEPEEYDPKVM